MSGIQKTFFLLAVVTSLLIGLGWYLGGIYGSFYAFIVAFFMNIISYFGCGKLALRFYRAKKLNAEEYPGLYKMAEKLAKNAEIPTPQLYIINSGQPNAFATGRNPEHGVIAFTLSLIELLDNNEIEAVMAHEMAHIKNRDTLIMTITATIAGAIGLLSNFVYLMIGTNDEGETNPVATAIIVILAPIMALLVQMSISRVREFEADRVGADICGNPLALAWALHKIQNGADEIYNIPAERNPATAHMFIINPIHGNIVSNLFSTHPNAKKRIDKLVKMHEDKFGPLPRDQEYFRDLEYRQIPWYKRIFKK
jgi:heat shock protein HtpX